MLLREIRFRLKPKREPNRRFTAKNSHECETRHVQNRTVNDEYEMQFEEANSV